MCTGVTSWCSWGDQMQLCVLGWPVEAVGVTKCNYVCWGDQVMCVCVCSAALLTCWYEILSFTISLSQGGSQVLMWVGDVLCNVLRDFTVVMDLLLTTWGFQQEFLDVLLLHCPLSNWGLPLLLCSRFRVARMLCFHWSPWESQKLVCGTN